MAPFEVGERAVEHINLDFALFLVKLDCVLQQVKKDLKVQAPVAANVF